jgi:Ca2+-binding RTX toxin-like protein
MRFLRNLFGSECKQTKRKSRRPAAGRRLGLEGLESRDLMAVAVLPSTLPTVQLQQPAAPAAVTISIQNNDLVIRGTDGPDDVTVTSLINSVSGKYEVKVTTGNTVTTSIWQITGGDVFFYGNKGDDKFSASTSQRVTAFGGEGNDQLMGSFGADKLNGGPGNDTLRGAPAGGLGNDTLIGEAGVDQLYGGNANDTLDGGAGADYIDGGYGNDTIWCGNDYEANNAFGGAGNDTITGSYGDDALHGGGGNDTIDGSLGRDEIFGDDGNDTLYAGKVFSDSNSNYLDGGNGHDKLYGNNGPDSLFGGAGNDYLYGGDGDDALNGNSGDDSLFGQAGNDILKGGNGYDKLYGGDGDDDLDGGDDNLTDYLRGGAGKDRFHPDPESDAWYKEFGWYTEDNFDVFADVEAGEQFL